MIKKYLKEHQDENAFKSIRMLTVNGSYLTKNKYSYKNKLLNLSKDFLHLNLIQILKNNYVNCMF